VARIRTAVGLDGSGRRLAALVTGAALGLGSLIGGGVAASAGSGPGAAAASGVAAPAAGTAPSGPDGPGYPAVGAGTHFLNHDTYLSGMNDKAWYEANIPFVDLPDQTLQDVYYYRWRVWREHVRYTNPSDGWVLTEFLDCCGYAAPYQAIDAAAGHHIDEGRWVRDTSYLDDYIRFWLTGPGAGPKPATEAFNPDTTDWAHEYSFWLASAAVGRAQVSGGFSELKTLLPQLQGQYHGWDKQFNAELGLYWSVPVWDAMELSASSYQSDDPYHGGDGYRPTLNSYQYGDAVAISRIAEMTGDKKTAKAYAARAGSLKAAMQKWLWDPKRKFYYDMPRENNPDHTLLDTREEIGFIPWQFGAASAGDDAAWAQLMDPQGFAAPFGPTTAERRSPLFMYEAGGCCRWDGPSWPFATAQTLTGMANLLEDDPSQRTVTKADYVDALTIYAKTQFRNGTPYVAEAHAPDDPNWIYDGRNHSEDYNHSTFNDLVLSGLLGIRAQDGAQLKLKPLIPDSWDHYAVENVPYHGHNVSILWDRDGSHYGQGAGMRVYVDGTLTRTAATVSEMTVPVGPAPGKGWTAPVGEDRLANDAANPLRQGFPKPITSYTWRFDDPWNAVDGKVWFNEVPENTRWTNYSSPNGSDFYGVDFGVPTPISDIRWYGYSDGGGVRPAADYRLQYWAGSAWAEVPEQTRDPAQPAGNARNRITFPTLTTTRIRLLFANPPGAFVGVTEFESWSPSSKDATVTVGAAANQGPAAFGTPVTIDGTTPIDVTVANTTSSKLAEPSVSLALPAGWSATETGVSGTKRRGEIAPNGSATWHFTVTPPAGALGTATDLVATASYQRVHGKQSVALQTHTRQLLQVAFNPAAYSSTVADDSFTTDTTANYTALKPSTDEVVPQLSAGNGRLTATSDQRFFTLLDRGLAPESTDAAVIVDPAAFIGNAQQQDSFFVGLIRDSGTYVTAWYNNHFGTSGIDVRIDGRLNPSGTGTCCSSVQVAPGYRLALQVHGTVLTSWAGHDGSWRRLGSTDVGSVISAADLSGFHVGFGPRGDPGTLAVGRFQAVSGTG